MNEIFHLNMLAVLFNVDLNDYNCYVAYKCEYYYRLVSTFVLQRSILPYNKSFSFYKRLISLARLLVDDFYPSYVFKISKSWF